MAHRTAVVGLDLSGGDHRRAHDAYHAAAHLWNRATDWVHTEWACGRSPSKHDIQHFCTALDPATRPLHAHTTIAVAMDLYDAIATARTSRAQGRRSRAPWRHKNYRPLSFARGFGWVVADARGHRLHIAYETADPAPGDPNVVAAIDEGIVNSLAVPPVALRPGALPTSLSVLVVNGRDG